MLRALSEMGASVGPSIADHLWQSTVFAVAAALLILALKKNQARARYWLWLAASMKFLIPFALLVNIGSHLARPGAAAAASDGLYTSMEDLSQPFAQRAARMVSPAVPSTSLAYPIPLLPPILAAVWLCGFITVLFTWWTRWRRMATAIREGTPFHEGREVEALRRAEHLGGIRKEIELLSCRSPEPGIFGILRPVLIWPAGISDRLSDAHLEAILAHEVGHVRRRDNLAAAMHMLVEAIFWFHPLVWWLGARLTEERERACDQEVLQRGNAPQVYAESILKACEFGVGSPPACLSGVAGAGLKQRIVRIMTQPVGYQLDFGRKAMLGIAALAAVAVPLLFGLQNPKPSSAGPQAGENPLPGAVFEVATFKPDPDPVGTGINFIDANGRLSAQGVTMRLLVSLAYGVNDFQVSGGPGWFASDRYVVEAKPDDTTLEKTRKLPRKQSWLVYQLMLQALLADRVKLSLHQTTRELPIFELVVAKNGPKLQEFNPDNTSPTVSKGPDGKRFPGVLATLDDGTVEGQGVSMDQFAGGLTRQLRQIVENKTGLTGKYDFSFKYSPNEAQVTMPNAGAGAGGASLSDSSAPSLFTAIQEWMGLKLESTKGPVPVFIIDHVERPSEN